MILVTRGASPTSLVGPKSAGVTERDDAGRFYGNPRNRELPFPFKAYKGADVRSALAAIFFEKCAYCESDYGPVGPVDIEHYRPKGAIELADGTIKKPGYYWLAASWENLLPSCIDCNRKRNQDHPGGSRISGKANRFPIVDERQRAALPGQESREVPYLLDPTRDDPREHLEFIDEGGVRATLDGEAEESEKGRRTIEVLGLNRHGLVRARRDRLLWVEAILKRFERAVARLNRDPADIDANLDVEYEIRELMDLMKPSSPYAEMARQRIEPTLRKHGVTP